MEEPEEPPPLIRKVPLLIGTLSSLAVLLVPLAAIEFCVRHFHR